jgi:hypothetical protein
MTSTTAHKYLAFRYFRLGRARHVDAPIEDKAAAARPTACSSPVAFYADLAGLSLTRAIRS